MAKKGQRGPMGPNGGAAMSFDQIAEVLGITRGGAWMLYKSAMRKLRSPRHARVLRELKALSDQRRRIGERE
jgi:hypothetical protein